MCEIRTGQKVAQHLDSYMVLTICMPCTCVRNASMPNVTEKLFSCIRQQATLITHQFLLTSIFVLGINMFLDSVHRLFYKSQRCENWMFSSSGKMMGAPTLVVPLHSANLNHWLNQRLRLALSNGPNRVGAPIILPEDGNKYSFRNFFLEILEDVQSPKTCSFQVQYTIVRTL
jgi:hypothetical protein